jgi:hypothetical protein
MFSPAHQQLHDVAGILHRNICPENILINPDGEEGSRGILIGLDHAIRLENKSDYSTQTKVVCAQVNQFGHKCCC